MPPQPIAFSSEPGRGLAVPWTVVPTVDRRYLLVLERAAGRVSRVDLATGALTRFESPRGSKPVVALGSEPSGTAALALVGYPDPPADPPLEPNVRGDIFRLDAATGAWTLLLENGFDGTGFFVDTSGTGAYTWREGIDHVDFATGRRDRLDGCADLPALLVDPAGLAAYTEYVYPGGVHTDDQAIVQRCELSTDHVAQTHVGYQLESLSLGCGGKRLFRAREGFAGFSTGETATTVLYDAFDATTLDPLAPLGASPCPFGERA